MSGTSVLDCGREESCDDPGHACDASLQGSLHSYDVVTGVDGPGTRFVAFLAGCPLRCLYCHNPDTWRRRDGTPMTVGELTERLSRYRDFLVSAGGGVTVSGGEPLLQPRFVAAFLRRAKAWGLHTAVDTSGFLGARADDALLDATDLVLLDVKSSDRVTYRHVTGRPLDPTLAFARRLATRGTPVWLRFVLVPGLTDAPDDVAGVAKIAAALGNVERVEVLPYHRLGREKYARLGLAYPLGDTPPPTPDQLERAREPFRARGLTVR